MRDVMLEKYGSGGKVGKFAKETTGMIQSCSINDTPSSDKKSSDQRDEDITVLRDEDITDQSVVLKDFIAASEHMPPVATPSNQSVQGDLSKSTFPVTIPVQSDENIASTKCKKCSLTLSKCRYQRKTNKRLKKRVSELKQQVKKLKAVIVKVSVYSIK